MEGVGCSQFVKAYHRGKQKLVEPMSAIGTERTSLFAPHMSALGVKRTWRFALHTSAFDPKRTWPFQNAWSNRYDAVVPSP